MTETITHRAFFGDGDHAFTLTDDMIAELEQISGAPIGALYLQFPLFAVAVATLREIIRLGLIGAGTAPIAAKRLTDTYATNRPITEIFPLAFGILDTRWNGASPEVTPDAAQSEPARTGDLGASLRLVE